MVTRGVGTARECPVALSVAPCGRYVREGQLMCALHWSRVPQDVKRAVWRTWRAWSAAMDDPTWAAYLDARTAALDAVGSR